MSGWDTIHRGGERMPVETNEVEYRTVQVGGALLVKSILNRLGVVAAIDRALKYQPEIAAT